MCEEYTSIVSTPTEANQIGRFDRYQYIGETQILAWYTGQASILVYLQSEYSNVLNWTFRYKHGLLIMTERARPKRICECDLKGVNVI